MNAPAVADSNVVACGGNPHGNPGTHLASEKTIGVVDLDFLVLPIQDFF